MKTTSEPSQHDWSRFDAMSEDERRAAVLADPDAGGRWRRNGWRE